MGMEIEGYRVIGPLAYQGKEGCMDVRCTRLGIRVEKGGTIDLGVCVGWHCEYCDEPCSSQGHRCEASRAMLDAARKVMDEERED